jgi:hypothetical protein
MSHPFFKYSPQPEDYWRSVVMFGLNVASYKFALARAILDLAPQPGQLVSLEELAVPFSSRICEHLRTADRQCTSRSSKFLDACRKANAGELERDALTAATVSLGFNNVIDAFHIVGRDEIPVRFFTDERGKLSGIRATDAFGKLLEGQQASNLPHEIEARWRLVETAWELNIARSLITVSHDPETKTLVASDHTRRKPITGARDALSGYQKGHCFYCFRSFSLLGPEPPDVDHFFPHSLKAVGMVAVDGVWNLVLSCPQCNRGAGGKSNRVPTLKLLERLSTRNEFLIESNHPLRQTLISQTGNSEDRRREFLNTMHREAIAALIHEWESPEVRAPLF